MKIQNMLLSQEKILWQGFPKKGVYFTQKDIALFPFTLIWGGFALMWENSVLSSPKAPPFLALFGLPFIAIALYMIFGRFLLDAWLRERTEYFVTNQRVIISRAAPFAQLTIINLSQLPNVNLTEKSDGSGIIRFGLSSSVFSNNRGLGAFTPALDPTPQFLSIPRAADVFKLIQQSSHV